MNNPCPEFWERYEAANQLSLKVEQELGLAVRDGKIDNIRQNLALIETKLQGIQELWDANMVTLNSGEKMFAPHYEALKQIFMDNYLPLESLEDSIELNETGGIDKFTVFAKPIVNLNSFRYLSTLRCLNLVSHNTFRDISPIATLRSLEEINLNNAELSDLSPLINLTKLSKLSLANDKITDISALRHLTLLTELKLSENQITDISPLSNLLHLHTLYLGKNRIENLSPIQHLTSIKFLSVNDSKVKNLEKCSGLINLEIILFNDCQVTDLSPLMNLPKLSLVHLERNLVRELSPLTQIPQLKYCFISGNPGCETSVGKAVVASLIQRGVMT